MRGLDFDMLHVPRVAVDTRLPRDDSVAPGIDSRSMP
jgi:hypothetical protein